MGQIENYRYYKDRHRCVQCHRQDAFTLNGRAYCADRIDRYKEYRKTYESVHAERISDARKKQRADRAAQGLCTRCGRPADPGYKTCSYCRAYARRRKSIQARRNGEPTIQERLERADNGFCWKCGKPAANGTTRFGAPLRLCPVCYDALCRASPLGVQALRDRNGGRMTFIDSCYVSISKGGVSNG